MTVAHNSIDETRLIRKLSKGDIQSFNILFGEYSGRLYRFAYGYLKSETESEELVQDVFMKIWEKRNSLKEELSVKAYIFTIAFNIIKKHFRSKAYREEYLQAFTGMDFDSRTYENITFNSLHQYVEELVELLPEKRRNIFIKSRFEGKNNKEIAEELNISQKTVENQLTDALKFIRIKLIRESTFLVLYLYFSIF